MLGQLLWELACQRCGPRVCVGAIARQARSCRGMWGQLLWELACQRCGPGFVSEPSRGKLAPAGLCGDSFCGSWLASDAGPGFVSEPSRGTLAPAGVCGDSFCGSWLASDAGSRFVSEPSRGKLAPAGLRGDSFCGSWLASDAGPDLCRSHTGIWVAGSFYVWNAECYLCCLVLWVIRIYPCCHDLQEVQHEKHSGCLYGSTCALGR